VSWQTVAICEMCWRAQEGDRTPLRANWPEPERCYQCGHPITSDVIFVRRQV